MDSPDAVAGAASRFWKETCVRLKAVDILQGTGLEQMGKELEFWCYRLDNVFPAGMHELLVRQMGFIFEVAGEASESGSMPGRKRVVACKHPCVCDPYGGGTKLGSPTVYQWGNAAAHLGQDAARPRLNPGIDTLLVQSATEYLVEVVGRVWGSVSDLEQQRRRDDLSRFYVVASECDETESSGPQADHNPLYSQKKQPQVVLRCNIAGDSILWIGPTQCENWFYGNDTCMPDGSLTTHRVVPIWGPKNSVIIMGGAFQENMLY